MTAPPFTTTQAASLTEHLPVTDAVAGSGIVSMVFLVLDPAGSGVYRLASVETDGLGSAEAVLDDVSGVLRLNSTPPGDYPLQHFSTAGVVLI